MLFNVLFCPPLLKCEKQMSEQIKALVKMIIFIVVL